MHYLFCIIVKIEVHLINQKIEKTSSKIEEKGSELFFLKTKEVKLK